MLRTPRIIVAQKVLASIRAMIVEKLLEEHNMRQSDVLALTKLTPSAIAQCTKGKRIVAYLEEIAGSKAIMKVVGGLVKALTRGYASDQSIVGKLCQVCRTPGSEGTSGSDQSASSY